MTSDKEITHHHIHYYALGTFMVYFFNQTKLQNPNKYETENLNKSQINVHTHTHKKNFH